MLDRDRRAPTGWAALALVLVAWVGFALSARATADARLTAYDVGAIRYVTPSLLLAPWWRSAWREVRRSDLRACALVALGGGLPFLLLTLAGARLSSAGHVTIVNLGVTPILLAAAASYRARRPPSPRAGVGLGIVGLGVAVVALATPGGRLGVLLLVCSAGLWAAYTLAQERARLSPTSAVLVMSAPSAVPALLLSGTHLASVPADEVVVFVLAQGLGSGVLSTVCFAIAVATLGSRTVGLVGALTPVLVALASAVLLDETLPPGAWAGLLLVVGGVVLASRPARRPSTPRPAPRGRPGARASRRTPRVPGPVGS